MAKVSALPRREFLRLSLVGGALLVVGGALSVEGCGTAKEFAGAWFRIDANGRITFINPQAEMGQGIWSSLAIAFVDELGGDWETTAIEAGEIRPEFRINPYVHEVFTAGSSSIANGLETVRLAGAALREMFVTAAATKTGTHEDQISIENGRILGPAGWSASLGELLDEVAALSIPRRPRLKATGQLRYLGKQFHAKEMHSKVTGAAVYGVDFRADGTLIATVRATPVHGAAVLRSNAKAVARMKGVRGVLPVPGGIGIVADDFWSAKCARDALEIEMDTRGLPTPAGSWAIEDVHAAALEGGKGVALAPKGDPEKIIAASKRTLTVEYSVPFLAHATMEPQSCTVRTTDSGVDVWTGTQGIEYLRDEVARALDVKPDQVHVHNLMLGGGFGRRYEADAAVQAALLAREFPGRPVKLIWTREEDIQQDFYRPAVMATMEAALGSAGVPEAMMVKISAPSISMHSPGFAKLVTRVDGAAMEGLDTAPYGIGHFAAEWLRYESPVRVGWWRSVGNSHNAFFKECFFDEIAQELGKDPLELRLEMLHGEGNRHLRKLLEALGGAANWNSPRTGRHQGIALHTTYGTTVGQVVEIAVSNDMVEVAHVTCAYDCGIVVNPQAIEAQLSGSVIWGLSAAMMGEISLDRGQVVQSNFHDYPIVTQAQAPDLTLIPVLSGGKPSGMGEPGVPPLAPALVNALSRALGRRIRRLPLSHAGLKLAERKRA